MPQVYSLKGVELSGQIGIHTTVYPPPPPIPSFSVSQLGELPLIGAGVSTSDQFGRAAAMELNTFVAGAPNQAVNGNNGAGSLYVYDYTVSDGWTQSAVLTAGSYAVASAQLGYSVAMNGDYIVAGAYWENSSRGAVYIFKKTNGTWGTTPIARLGNDTGASGDQFGISVAVSGSTVLVGSSGDDRTGSNGGVAFIYSENSGNWVKEATLTAGINEEAGAEFGISVSLEGTKAVVGSWKEDSRKGAVYVFTRVSVGDWGVPDRIQPNAPVASSRFGTSVRLRDGVMIVGAPVVSGGRAYIFQNDAGIWNQKAILDARSSGGMITDTSVGTADSQGISVDVDPDTGIAVVGAQRNQGGMGTVYIFEDVYGTWMPSAMVPSKIEATDGASNDYFGLPVVTDRGKIIVGASRRDNDGESDAGAIYPFE